MAGFYLSSMTKNNPKSLEELISDESIEKFMDIVSRLPDRETANIKIGWIIHFYKASNEDKLKKIIQLFDEEYSIDVSFLIPPPIH